MVLFLTAVSAPAGTLTTRSYEIKIEVECPEYNVTCDHVKFTGVDRKSGKTIALTGRTVHTIGKDGVTPSRFLGYEFNDGSAKYFVGDDGELRITHRSKVLLDETGEWKY
jgi:hypothetical protein